ncbi:MAG: hypothetical protein ABIJ14_00755 [Nanoarchaeota archaeon]|nr:hypothetical protein [Nanoarchaeota archaeon]
MSLLAERVFHGLMKVKKDRGGDYYLHVLMDGVEKIINPCCGVGGFRYHWLEAVVESEGIEVDETLGLTCSNNCRVASAQGKMTLNRGENDEYPQDINIRVFPYELGRLLERKVNYLMTRHDGENKVWIYLDDEFPPIINFKV